MVIGVFNFAGSARGVRILSIVNCLESGGIYGCGVGILELFNEYTLVFCNCVCILYSINFNSENSSIPNFWRNEINIPLK